MKSPYDISPTFPMPIPPPPPNPQRPVPVPVSPIYRR